MRRSGSAAPPDDPSDGRLIREVLDGDADRFGSLVERYQRPYLLYATRMVSSRAVAEDIVQESFVTAYEKLESCEHPERFASWCFHIVRNRCYDHLRSPRSRSEEPDVLEELPAEVDDPAHGAERSDLRAALIRALEELSPLLREAFVVYHEEELTYPEMADRLGASESALKMRVKRAREELQDRLDAYGP
ncbi:MAG: RNA polymerase sigma factor [Gemmatimonadota bacterium]